MQRRTAKVIIFLAVFTSISISADMPDGYKFLSFNQALVNSSKDQKNVFIYYGRVGCGFCEMTNQRSFSKNEVKIIFNQSYHMVYLDSEGGRRITLPSGEKITERQLGERMNILGTPVFIVMNSNGKQISRLEGFQSPENFKKMDEFVKSHSYDVSKLPDLIN